MTKLLFKFLAPSPAKLASLAAEKVAAAVNASDKAESIAKYATLSKCFTEASARVATMLADGKIDAKEQEECTQELEKILTRAYEKIIELL